MIKKIAVVRANALGDFIFSLPALTALRKTFPQAEIVLLAKSWHKAFLSGRKSPINRVIVVPKAPGVGEENTYQPNVHELNLFFQVMKKEQFDIAIQMHGGGVYSNPFTKNLGASFTIGLQSSNAEPLDMTIPYEYYQNEYLRYLELVNILNVRSVRITPFIQKNDSDIDEVSKYLPQLSKSFVVIHPGANDIRRRWDSNYFARIGDFLVEKGFQVVITGTRGEEELVDRVMRSMKYQPINACNTLSLNGLTGLLALATLVVSNDTGPFHLAYALQTPVIGLFWCGNMINGGPLTRTLSRPLVSWITHCPLCHTDCAAFFPFQPQTTCKHAVSFISDISPEQVMQTIERMIEEKVVNFLR